MLNDLKKKKKHNNNKIECLTSYTNNTSRFTILNMMKKLLKRK